LFRAERLMNLLTYRQTDIQIEMTKLIVAFHNFANVLKHSFPHVILIVASNKDSDCSG
jgi:hypothetical protein